MKIIKTKLQGVLQIDLDCFEDERGFFLESYQVERYKRYGISDTFVQENHSRSSRGVLRGMHYQIKSPQAQIVTIMHGSVYYVCVDVRRDSDTFGMWEGVELSDKGIMQLYMAPGFAGGFCNLSELADLHYKVSGFYDPSDEGGVLWNDSDININWPISNPKITSRDGKFLKLADISNNLLPLSNSL
jgi:dTDP-4-dehydrorhamnose 3,5-epimerase